MKRAAHSVASSAAVFVCLAALYRPIVSASPEIGSQAPAASKPQQILITDGGESCKGDPVQAAADLKASGLDLRLNIVGFAVTDPAVQ